MLSGLTCLGMPPQGALLLRVSRLTECRLLKSSSHADLTIRSGSYEIKAHKNIVSQCGFFAGACRKDGAFLVRRRLLCLACCDYQCTFDLPFITHVKSPPY